MTGNGLPETPTPFAHIREHSWFVLAEGALPHPLYLRKGGTGTVVGTVVSDAHGLCAMLTADGHDDASSGIEFPDQEPCIPVVGINVCVVTED